MIKHGVALMRLASNPHGCVGVNAALEEFYVVMFDGKIMEARFKSYAEAFKHSEMMWKAVRAVKDVA